MMKVKKKVDEKLEIIRNNKRIEKKRRDIINIKKLKVKEMK